MYSLSVIWSSAPEISAPVFVLQIRVPIEDHQCAFALERPHKLCYTHVRRDTHQKMYVVWAGLPLDYFHFHLFAQLFYDLDHIFSYCFVDHFSSVLWCEYHVVFTPVTGMCCMFYFIFHLG